MPMLGPLKWLIACLSSRAAAKPWAKLPQLRRVRLIPRSFCSAMRPRWRVRIAFERSMIRSVTRETFELRGMSRPLLVPADAVALRQRNRRRGAPRSGRIGSWSHALVGPGGADAVDPRPLRLDLVAANKQCWITLDQ